MNSSNYHNQSYSNPSTMRVVSEWYKAEDVFVGEFKLSSTLISAIGNSQSYPVTEDMYEQFSDSLRSEALLYSGVLYLGSSPQNPIIGDIKVSYQVYPEQEVSVVAMQQNGRAVGFTTTNGRVLEILYSGFKTADQIFATEQTKNVILTWVIRGAGIMLMYVGLMLSVGQLARLFSWIPLLGAAVASGIALMAGLLSISLSFIVISVAWIFYRPTLGIGLLLVAGFLVFVLIKKAQWMDDDDEISTEPPPPPPLPVP
ncbi:MAG: TMEM43 family protein [Nitrospinota bacterium]|nr:TMEM43 family protein [Nitrospinota bacterium]